MVFKPTHYGKVWRKLSRSPYTGKGRKRMLSFRWAYSGNFGQWRKLQYDAGWGPSRGHDSDWRFVSKAWELSPSRSAVPWRKYR